MPIGRNKTLTIADGDTDIQGGFMKICAAIGVALLLWFANDTSAQSSQSQSSTKAMRAAGRVDAVTDASITILAGADKMTLVVDDQTKVVGRGLSTKTRDMKAEGHSPAMSDFVKPADSVVVTYVDAGEGKLRATEVNVRLIAK